MGCLRANPRWAKCQETSAKLLIFALQLSLRIFTEFSFFFENPGRKLGARPASKLTFFFPKFQKTLAKVGRKFSESFLKVFHEFWHPNHQIQERPDTAWCCDHPWGTHPWIQSVRLLVRKSFNWALTVNFAQLAFGGLA